MVLLFNNEGMGWGRRSEISETMVLIQLSYVTTASGLNLFFFSIQDITTFNICLSFSIDVSTIKLCTAGNCSMAWV